MNDIKKKGQLPIISLAALSLSRESGRQDGQMDGSITICPWALKHRSCLI
jgi:hypothetical protein